MHRRVLTALLAGALLAVLLVAAARASLAHRTDPSACGGCHTAQVEAWAGSRHASAARNDTFWMAFAATEHPWCLGCHAATSEADGVACAACHGPPDDLRSTRPSLSARLAHPIRHDDDLADERACVGCHQFSLPDPAALHAVYGQGLPMVLSSTPAQDTVAEWRRSAAAAQGTSCTGCHDPHDPPGAHDPDFVRGALSVEARYDGEQVIATITAKGAAHAVPTGDPFRRLSLSVCEPYRCDQPFARRLLRRLPKEDGHDWTVTDTRIGPADAGDAASVTLTMPLAMPLPPGARWRLVYHLTDPDHAPHLPPDEAYYVVDQGFLVPGVLEAL